MFLKSMPQLMMSKKTPMWQHGVGPFLKHSQHCGSVSLSGISELFGKFDFQSVDPWTLL